MIRQHFKPARLLEILKKPRGEPSATQRFMRWWFAKFTPSILPWCDIYGNYHWVVPMADGSKSATLFTAHTDTVDTTNRGTKNLGYWKNLDTLGLLGAQPKGVGCLGADDGAGCEILCCLAEAKVPGYYLWTAEEETGCKGIQGIIKDALVDFTQFKRAVAFDRAGYTDVINWQMGGQCCSKEFADDLIRKLGDTWYDESGTFTDTAKLIHVIPECTNLSVGYDCQHTYKETLHLGFLDNLIGKLKTLEWETLVTKRIPKEPQVYAYTGDYGHYDLTTSDIVFYEPEYVIAFLKERGISKELEYKYNEEKRYSKGYSYRNYGY
jgi:hypothetical protein